MKTLLPLLFLVLFNSLFGQNNFSIENGSKIFSAKITVETCNDDNCEGIGTIKLFKKETGKLFQTLKSDNLYFYFHKTKKPTVNIIELYDEQSPLIFEDFNFDGSEDLAIRNGNESGYGGPSYDVYVYNITKKQFVLSSELTSLATENLGMFQTDQKRKRIITFAKSGCCYHITNEYAVIPKKGLVNVYQLEEDAQGGETVVVTEKNLVNGKWITKKKKYKIEDYYKN